MEINNLKICLAGLENIDDILHIEKCSLEECEIYSQNIIEENLNNLINLIAIYDNKPVGYICCSYIYDEAELLKICVLPDFQNNKIGYNLLNQMIRELKEKLVKSIFLEVRSCNEKALGFYYKYGFKKISTRANYYSDGTNAEILKYIIP